MRLSTSASFSTIDSVVLQPGAKKPAVTGERENSRRKRLTPGRNRAGCTHISITITQNGGHERSAMGTQVVAEGESLRKAANLRVWLSSCPGAIKLSSTSQSCEATASIHSTRVDATRHACSPRFSAWLRLTLVCCERVCFGQRANETPRPASPMIWAAIHSRFRDEPRRRARHDSRRLYRPPG